MKQRVNGEQSEPPMKLRKVDYVKLAKICGKDAYESAREAGLPEETALTFGKVFGTPVEPEFRIS